MEGKRYSFIAYLFADDVLASVITIFNEEDSVKSTACRDVSK